jgi:hypothetical protein
LPFIYTYMMGYTNVCNYDGSFYEWAFDGTNPVDTGFPSDSSEFDGEVSAANLMHDLMKAATMQSIFVK